MSTVEYGVYRAGFRDGGLAAIVQVNDIAKHHPATTRDDLIDAIILAIRDATGVTP